MLEVIKEEKQLLKDKKYLNQIKPIFSEKEKVIYEKYFALKKELAKDSKNAFDNLSRNADKLFTWDFEKVH